MVERKVSIPARYLFLLLPFLMAGSGCVNLEAVREFAAMSAETAAFTGLAVDYAESPLRMKRIQPEGFHADLDRNATERAAQVESLLCQQAVIEEYMVLLWQLASEEAVTFDEEIDALGERIRKTGLADPAACTGIVSILATAVADGWRQKKIKELIELSNSHFQKVVAAMRQIVEQGFRGAVEDEKICFTNYFRKIILQLRDAEGADSYNAACAAAALASVTDLNERKLDLLARKRAAIDSYLQVLDTIARSHQRLFDGRSDLSDEALREFLYRHARKMRKELKRMEAGGER